jgi:hypothetical protein
MYITRLEIPTNLILLQKYLQKKIVLNLLLARDIAHWYVLVQIKFPTAETGLEARNVRNSE